MSAIQDFRQMLKQRKARSKQAVQERPDFYYEVFWDNPQTVEISGQQYTVYPTRLRIDRQPMQNAAMRSRGVLTPVCQAGSMGPMISRGARLNGGWGTPDCAVLDNAELSEASFIAEGTILKGHARVGGFSYLRNSVVENDARVSDSYLRDSHISDEAQVERSYGSALSMFDSSSCRDSEVAKSTLWDFSEVKDHAQVVGGTNGESKLTGHTSISKSMVETSELRDVDVSEGSRIIKSGAVGVHIIESEFYKTMLGSGDYGQTFRRQTVINGEKQSPRGMNIDVPSEDTSYDDRYETLHFD